jgi:hypothetical protein
VAAGGQWKRSRHSEQCIDRPAKGVCGVKIAKYPNLDNDLPVLIDMRFAKKLLGNNPLPLDPRRFYDAGTSCRKADSGSRKM